MGSLLERGAKLGLALVVITVLACGDDGGTGASAGSSQDGEGGNPSTGGAGGSPATGGGGFGGRADGGGGAGEGGMGGMPMPTPPGPPGNALVSAGDRISSTNYSLVFTMGQSTQNQSKMTSQTYRLQGGLIGATGN